MDEDTGSVQHKKGWVVNHLWDNAPGPMLFWEGSVAEAYIDEAFLWADIETGDPLAECSPVTIPADQFDAVHVGFPSHQLNFYKCANFVPDEKTRRLVVSDEPFSDALLYFDSLHYDPEAYPGLYSEGDIYLEILPHKTIFGKRRVRLYVEGSDFALVDETFDSEMNMLMGMTMEDFETEGSPHE